MVFQLENAAPIIHHATRPHRGVAVLVLGVVSLFTIPFILGPIAWAMGSNDLRQMSLCRMDPAGRGMTEAGRICGIVSTIFGLLLFAVFVLQLLLVWSIALR